MDINKFKINFRNIFSFDKAKNAVIALVLASIFNPALNRCGIKRKKNLKYFEGICVQALNDQIISSLFESAIFVHNKAKNVGIPIIHRDGEAF